MYLDESTIAWWCSWTGEYSEGILLNDKVNIVHAIETVPAIAGALHIIGCDARQKKSILLKVLHIMMHFEMPTINLLTRSRLLTIKICRECMQRPVDTSLALWWLEQAIHITLMEKEDSQHPPAWSTKVMESFNDPSPKLSKGYNDGFQSR